MPQLDNARSVNVSARACPKDPRGRMAGTARIYERAVLAQVHGECKASPRCQESMRTLVLRQEHAPKLGIAGMIYRMRQRLMVI